MVHQANRAWDSRTLGSIPSQSVVRFGMHNEDPDLRQFSRGQIGGQHKAFLFCDRFILSCPCWLGTWNPAALAFRVAGMMGMLHYALLNFNKIRFKKPNDKYIYFKFQKIVCMQNWNFSSQIYL